MFRVVRGTAARERTPWHPSSSRGTPRWLMSPRRSRTPKVTHLRPWRRAHPALARRCRAWAIFCTSSHLMVSHRQCAPPSSAAGRLRRCAARPICCSSHAHGHRIAVFAAELQHKLLRWSCHDRSRAHRAVLFPVHLFWVQPMYVVFRIVVVRTSAL